MWHSASPNTDKKSAAAATPQLSEAMKLYISQREFEAAYSLAVMRDRFYWILASSLSYTAIAGAAYLNGVRPAWRYGLPILPIVVLNAWWYDASFGKGQMRVREEAGRIILRESARFALPEGNQLMPTEEYLELFVRPRTRKLSQSSLLSGSRS